MVIRVLQKQFFQTQLKISQRMRENKRKTQKETRLRVTTTLCLCTVVLNANISMLTKIHSDSTNIMLLFSWH